MPYSRKLVYFIVFIVLLVWLYWLFSVWDKGEEKPQHNSSNVIIETDNLKESCPAWDPNFPIVYAITPTYASHLQKAELTRLSQTLRLVPNFHWILVEDAIEPSTVVANLLNTSTLNFTHLATPTPLESKPIFGVNYISLLQPEWTKTRGVWQLNAGIEWLRENRNKDTDRGVVYFADVDNTYSLQLFQEMRYIKKVGVWPVGLLGGPKLETPVIDPATCNVVDWNTVYNQTPELAIDMAGFAVNLQHLLSHPEAKFLSDPKVGLVESTFLLQLISRDDLEPKANNCTKVYVWLTRTREPRFRKDQREILSLPAVQNIEV